MANGVLFNALFQGDEDNLRHVLYGAWLWRDWDFATTSLTGFNPFGSDGNLAGTLFEANNPGGPWYDPGYLDEKGPDFEQKIETKPTRVMQSRWAARYDYISESEEISGTLMESNPIVDALHNNQSLANLQSIGAPGYSSATPVELDIHWRQCLFIGVDGRSGLNYYIVRVYPKVLITDYGKTPWNAEETASLPIKGQCVPDAYSIPPDGVNVGSPRWILRDGPAWRAQGPQTLWAGSQVAPVATAEAGEEAAVVLAVPVSLNSPFSYEVTQYTSGVSSMATIVGTPTTTNGSVTITVGGLVVGDVYTFTVIASGATGTPSLPSLPSNSVTAEA